MGISWQHNYLRVLGNSVDEACPVEARIFAEGLCHEGQGKFGSCRCLRKKGREVLSLGSSVSSERGFGGIAGFINRMDPAI